MDAEERRAEAAAEEKGRRALLVALIASLTVIAVAALVVLGGGRSSAPIVRDADGGFDAQTPGLVAEQAERPKAEASAFNAVMARTRDWTIPRIARSFYSYPAGQTFLCGEVEDRARGASRQRFIATEGQALIGAEVTDALWQERCTTRRRG